MKKIKVNNLSIDENLLKFINQEVIPGTDVSVDSFWDGFSKAVENLTPINKKLLEKREEIQKKN